jgi:hypothetical protein
MNVVCLALIIKGECPKNCFKCSHKPEVKKQC